MKTLQDFLNADVQGRANGFYNYLMTSDKRTKSEGTARAYAMSWAVSDFVKEFVFKTTGLTVLYDVVDIKDIEDILGEIMSAQDNKVLHGYPSATVAAYKRYIEHLSHNSSGTLVVPAVSSAPAIVKRASSINMPGSAGYRPSSTFVKSSVPSALEEELMEMIVNYNLPLVNVDVCFADIIDKIEVVFSPEMKVKTSVVDPGVLRARLRAIEHEISELETICERIRTNPAEYAECPSFGNSSLFDRLGILYSLADEIHGLLKKADTQVEVESRIMGEFIPGADPKVVLYYKNMHNDPRVRYSTLLGTFVHEMFHAWNYFQAGERARAVLAVDEPMVEFASLYFLNRLVQDAASSGHCLKSEISTVYSQRRHSVMCKQNEMGEIAAYGFGYYLYEHIAGDEPCRWIEEYSAKSAGVDPNQRIVQKIKAALIPVYPINEESRVLGWFKNVIFGKATALKVSGAIAAPATVMAQPSFKDMMVACIKVIGRKYFDVKDIYAFEPIFAVSYPACANLKDAIREQLDELVKDGTLDSLPPDHYSVK